MRIETKSNPYGFTDQFSASIDWSGFLGEVVPTISGHNEPISKEELARICASKQRENNFVRALRCLKYSGESDKARALFKQILD